MAISFSSRILRHMRQGLLAGAFAVTTFTVSGCKLMETTTETAVAPAVVVAAPAPQTAAQAKALAAVPKGVPHEICTYWDKTVASAPDPQNDYQLSPVLVGRMILIGPNKTPVCCDGTVQVKLWDERPAAGGDPVILETWNVDQENLKKMIFLDSLKMWGYTLALPTATCKPGVTRVRVEVLYKPSEPKEASPLYAKAENIRLDYSELMQKHATALPASFRQSVPGPGMMPPGGPQQYPYQPQMQMQQGMPYQPQMPAPQYQPQMPVQPMMPYQPMPGQQPMNQGYPGQMPAQQPAPATSMMAPRYPQPAQGAPMMVSPGQAQMMPAPAMQQQTMMAPQYQQLMGPQQLMPAQYQTNAMQQPVTQASAQMLPPMPAPVGAAK